MYADEIEMNATFVQPGELHRRLEFWGNLASDVLGLDGATQPPNTQARFGKRHDT